MVREPGNSTADLRVAGHITPVESELPPEQREDRMQRWGGACILIGTGTIFATFVAMLVSAIITRVDLFPSKVGAMFGMLSALALLTAGGITLAYGLQERLHRPHRSMSRLSYGAGQKIVDRLDKLDERMTEFEDQAALNAAALHRIETVIEKVPNTGQIIAQAIRLASVNGADPS